MKFKKHLAIPLLALGMLAISSFISGSQSFQGLNLSTQAYADEEITGQCGDNLTYTLSADKTTLTISGTGDMYNYNYKEDSLAPWSEYKSTITTLQLNDGITSIGSYAFYYCSNFAGNLTIPNSVKTIKSHAFDHCSSIKTLKLGNSVETIGSDAFDHCSSIKTLTLGNSVKTIGSGAFYDCSNISTIKFGNSVESIGSAAFSGCKSLTDTITLPPTVRSIGSSYVFDNPNITVLITSIDVSIGSYAFGKATIIPGSGGYLDKSRCVKEVQCYPGSDVETYEYLADPDNYAPIRRTVLNNGKCGDNLTFKIANYPNSVIIVIEGEGDMYDFPQGNTPWAKLSDKIDTVMFTSNNVYSIGDNAFYGCKNLNAISVGLGSIKYVLVPDGVTRVGKNAFYGCSSLEADVTSSTFYNVGENAFYGCSSLTGDLKIINVTRVSDSNYIKIGDNAFNGCNNISSVKVLKNGSEIRSMNLGSMCFGGIETLYCFKNSVADNSEANLGCAQKKYIAENATLEINVPIEDNDEWVHKVGVSVTNGDTSFDEELINYVESDTEYKFVADMYINEAISKPLNYITYYIYNYADGDYDKEIAEGSVKPDSEDDKSDKKTLFKKILSQGTLDFTLKEVE